MLVRKGDTVVILAGKDRGKRGTVDRVMKDAQQVVVGGMNIAKRHMKPSSKYPSGGIVEISTPIHQSNVMVVNPDTDQPGRTSADRQGKIVTRLFKGNQTKRAKSQ
jgi:large subunit ribosomal protein L24